MLGEYRDPVLFTGITVSSAAADGLDVPGDPSVGVVLYALLAISLIISLLGIVNALVLSIYERTREIGMLRAIGTPRRQMRAIVRYERIITAVIGGVLGIGIGVLFAWVLARGIADQGIRFTLPVGTLVVFLVLAILAGVLAAVLPARRAAKLKPLDALHFE